MKHSGIYNTENTMVYIEMQKQKYDSYDNQQIKIGVSIFFYMFIIQNPIGRIYQLD